MIGFFHHRYAICCVALLMAFGLSACAGSDDLGETDFNQSTNQTENQTANQNQSANQNQTANQNQSQNQTQNQTENPNQSQNQSQNQTQNQSQNQTQNQTQNGGELQSCDTDGDCPTGEVCAFFAGSAGVETVCLDDNGGGAAGESCSDDGDCLARLCLDGSCSAPCDDRDGCGPYQLCEENTISLGGEQGTFDVCEDIPLQYCQSSVECSPEELLMCNIIAEDSSQNYVGLCGLINDGEAGLGEDCTGHDSCESDFCWANESTSAPGECTVLCQDAGRDCASGQVCAGLTEDLRVCLGECATSTDCTGENVCGLGIDETNSSVITYCSNKVGNTPTGGACTSSADCETALCLTVTSFETNNVFCTSNSDCTVDHPECLCPPENPNCFSAERLCMATTDVSVCSELCDDANGDADCAAGGHDLVVCDPTVTVTWTGGSQFVSTCTFGLEEE